MKMSEEKLWILSGVQPSHRSVYTGTLTNNRFSWPIIFSSIQIFVYLLSSYNVQRPLYSDFKTQGTQGTWEGSGFNDNLENEDSWHSLSYLFFKTFLLEYTCFTSCVSFCCAAQ